MPELQVVINANKAKQGAATYVSATNRMRGSTTRVDRSVRGFQTRLTKLGGTASSVGRTVGGLFAGFGAIQGIRSAVKTIVSFEDSMQTVRAVMRTSQQDFDALSESARKMGEATRFSATEAADAVVFLGRAGFDANQAMQALPATLDLAAAGAIGLAEAADIASNVVKQFNLDASDTRRVADVMVAATNRSNTNITQLADAMKLAGPQANALGLSVEETASLIGVLGDAGIQGTMAGTNLRQIMLALVAPVGDAGASLERLGVSTQQAAKLLDGGLVKTLETLEENAFGAGDAASIFQRRASGGALVLASSTARIKELAKSLVDASEGMGASAIAAETMSNDIEGAWKTLISVTQELFLRIGDAGVGKALRSLIDVAADVVRALAGIEMEIENLVGAQDIQRAENYAKTIRNIADALKIVGLTVGALVAVKVAFIALNLVMAVNPFIALTTLVLAAGAALFVFRDKLVTIGDTTASVGDFILATWDIIKRALKLVFLVIAREFKMRWQLMVRILESSLGLMTDLVQFFIGDFGTTWSLFWQAIKDTVFDFANFAISSFKTVLLWIDKNLQKLSEVAVAFTNFDFSKPLDSIGAVSAALGSAFDKDKLAEQATEFNNEVSLLFGQEHLQVWLNGGKNAAGEYQEGWLTSISNFGAKAKAAIDAEFAKDFDGKSITDEAAKLILNPFNEIQKVAADIKDKRDRALLPDFLEAQIASLKGKFPLPDDSVLNDDSVRVKALTKEQFAAVGQINSMIVALERESVLLSIVDEDAREMAAAMLKLQDASIKGGLSLEMMEKFTVQLQTAMQDKQAVEAFNRSIEEAAEAAEELVESQTSARESIDDMFAALEREQRLLGLTGKSRELRIAQLKLEELATVAGIQNVQQLQDRYSELFESVSKDTDSLASSVADMSDSFSDAFADIILGARSAQEAMHQLGLEITRSVVKKAITDPISDTLAASLSGIISGVTGGLGGGAGNVAVNVATNAATQVATTLADAAKAAPTKRFATGGIITGRREFMFDGGRGVMGEAGPEAIIPLKSSGGVTKFGLGDILRDALIGEGTLPNDAFFNIRRILGRTIRGGGLLAGAGPLVNIQQWLGAVLPQNFEESQLTGTERLTSFVGGLPGEIGGLLSGALTSFLPEPTLANFALNPKLTAASFAFNTLGSSSLFNPMVGVRQFAQGGVITGPTMFGTGGGLGLAGEAGPEAIMPLSRGSDGKLGVRSEGQGRNVVVNMTIVTANADSFRRSDKQILSGIRSAVVRL